MNRGGRWALAIILCQLVAPAHAQEPAMAPVQTVVDAVGRVVTEALVEAPVDGTADRAAATAAALLAFVDGLDVQHGFPPGSAAAEAGLQEGLEYAAALARSITGFPEEAGALYTQWAACQSPAASLMREQARALTGAGRDVVARLAAWSLLLHQAADEAPAGVDPQPLRRAAQRIETVLEQEAPSALDCFTTLEAEFNITVDGAVLLRVVPDRTWPTGQVRAIGALRSGQAPVTLRVPSLGIAHEVGQAFAVRIEVPRDAPLGTHEVRAEAAGMVATAPLLVDRAPSRLEVDAPRQVLPGASFGLRVEVRTVLPEDVGAGPLRLTGDASAELEFTGVVAQHQVQAEGPGLLRVRIDYAGSERVAPSSADLVVQVAQPSDPSPRVRDEGPSIRPGDLWREQLPWWLVASALLVVLAVLVAPWLRRPRAAVATAGQALVPPPLPGRGLVASVAAFMAWLRHLGRARPGTTVRQAAQEVPGWQDLVEPFEQARYGPRVEAAEPPDAMGRLRSLLARLRREP